MRRKIFSTEQAEQILDTLRLPTDSVCGDIVITITGNRSVFVENYRGILEYEDHRIVLQGKQNKVSIYGKHLKISYYTNENMRVKGMISDVKLGERLSLAPVPRKG